MKHRLLHRYVVGLPLVCALACQGSADSERSAPPPEAVSRDVRSIVWDTTFFTSSPGPDTTLLLPRIFVVGEGGNVYAFDYGDHRLKAFAGDGSLRWVFGRRGEGPGEFAGVVDIEIDANEDIWLMDAGAGRLTIVSREGDLKRHILLQEDHAVHDILPLPERIIATAYAAPNVFLVELSDEGLATATHPYPTQRLRSAFYSARQAYSTTSNDGRWMSLFPFGDLLLVYDGTRLTCQGDLIEGGDFPTTMPTERPPVWAASGGLTDDLAYILPNGTTEYALRILDVYGARDCRYLYSLTLPTESKSIYVRNGTIYLEFENPHPSILGVRPSERGAN
jgi:hypothetical protein